MFFWGRFHREGVGIGRIHNKLLTKQWTKPNRNRRHEAGAICHICCPESHMTHFIHHISHTVILVIIHNEPSGNPWTILILQVCWLHPEFWWVQPCLTPSFHGSTPVSKCGSRMLLPSRWLPSRLPRYSARPRRLNEWDIEPLPGGDMGRTMGPVWVFKFRLKKKCSLTNPLTLKLVAGCCGCQVLSQFVDPIGAPFASHFSTGTQVFTSQWFQHVSTGTDEPPSPENRQLS